MKANPGRLKFRVQMFDIVDGNGGRQQVLAFPECLVEYGVIDMPEVEQRRVAADLCVEWRIPVEEIDGEAELAGEEGARSSDVADEQLRLGGSEDRSGRYPLCLLGHGRAFYLFRVPA